MNNRWTEILTKSNSLGLGIIGPWAEPGTGYQLVGPEWIKWVGTDQDAIVALLDHLKAGGQTEVVFTTEKANASISSGS